MFKLKKIVALLLCFVMLSSVVLTSCDSGDSDGGGSQDTSQNTSSNDTSGDNSSQDKPSDSKPNDDGDSNDDNQTNNNGGGNEQTTVLAAGVTLNKTTLSLIKGSSETLAATVAPADTTDKALTWTSSNTSVATVVNGIVTAAGAGTATITVTTANGKTATCEVTVSVLASGVLLNKNNLSLIKGSSETLTATVAPTDTTDKTLTWVSSNTNVATVANGTVTAIGTGTATITVTTANGKTATCEVTVSVLTSGISLNKNNLSLTKGGSETLTATVAPADTADQTLTWTTSNQNIATVANGTVTAVGAGTAIITVTTANGKTATCEVTVSVLAVEITLDKSSVSLVEGETTTILANISPTDTTDSTITWTSSDSSIASVDSNGKITAVSSGIAVIIATTANGLSSSCSITVTEAEIVATNITLSQSTVSISLGDILTLSATITPNNVTNKSVVWSSSDHSIATVHNGTVVAVGVGTATITATTSNGKTTSCVITVSGGVSGVSLNTTAVELDKGDSITLTATVEGDTSAKILWTSSDVSVATVSSNGKVKAIAPGYAIITAVINGTDYYATCYIFVSGTSGGNTEDNRSDWQKDGKLKNLPEPDFGTCTNVTSGGANFVDVTRADAMSYLNKLEYMGYSFSATANTSLVYAGTGSNGVYTVSIGWTLNGNNFSVLVHGGASGEDSGENDDYDDEVITPTSVFLNQSTLFLTTGNSEVLVAMVLPVEAEEKAVYWTSSNTGVVTVRNGIVTAVGKGTATITVRTINGKSAICTVTVTTPVAQIVLDKTDVTLEKNETLTLSASILPTDADDATLSWTSSNSAVVTVENGVLRAVGKGSATITASTANGVSAICNVTVTVSASSISLNAETKNMVEGDTATLIATVYPEDATDKNITWKSSDPSVVAVDSNGNLTAVSAGTAIITATTANNVVASCVVTVSNIAVNLNKTSLQMIIGGTETLIATITPDTAMNQDIVWTSSDPSIVTVTNGVLTAKKVGTVTIAARSVAGESVATCRVTVLPYTVSFGALQQNGKNLYATVSNSTTSFSFKDEITLQGNDMFVVSSDENGENTIITKNVSLKEGDNTYYIHIASGDDVETYKVVIRRKPMYSVTFKHGNGDDVVAKVEEGNLVSRPDINYPGYTLIGWDCDFTQPITEHKVITATWRVSDEMADFEFTTVGQECTITGVRDKTKSEYAIPNYVTKIGEKAFYKCINLTSIEIPESVKAIDAEAFTRCYKLIEVINRSTLSIEAGEEDNGDVAFYAKAVHSGDTRIVNKGGYVFYAHEGDNYLVCYVGADTNLILPENLNDENYEINDNAFLNRTDITGVVISDGVTVVRDSAFKGCLGLTSLTIGSSVTIIHQFAFYNCTRLEEINFNATNMIDFRSADQKFDYAGHDGSGITVNIGANVTRIPAYFFYNHSDSSHAPNITSVIFEDGSVCESIGYSAFRECTKLNSITIPENITSIGNYAFYGCEGVMEINFNAIAMNDLHEGSRVFYTVGSLGNGFTLNIGKSVTKIPAHMLDPRGTSSYNLPRVTSIVFAEGGVCESIGDSAFYYALKLTSITIPDSITYIGNYAFYRCSALTEINFNAVAMEDLGDNNYVFYDAGNSGDGITFNIGANVTRIPAYLFYPYSASNTKWLPNIESVFLAEGTICKGVGNKAFYNCSNLTSVHITDIADWCNISFSNSVSNPLFYANNLYLNGTLVTDLVIPDSVTSIGNHAFSGCDSLRSVHITDLIAWCNISFSSIDSNPLYYANNLYLSGTLVTDLVIPDGVTSIGSYAFYNCDSLTSITIPDSVTSIGSYAFYYCDSLTSIIFERTSGWQRLSTKTATNGQSISSTSLANTSTAATYLRSTYSNYYWKCS